MGINSLFILKTPILLIFLRLITNEDNLIMTNKRHIWCWEHWNYMNNLYNPQLTKRVIIGTKSKSRRDLFKSLGLSFRYKSPNIDEKSVANLNNNRFDAIKIATAKARSLSSIHKNKIIVTFDTTILFQKKTVYKCDSPECCIKLLNSFSNRKHLLFTGMVFMINNKIVQKKLTNRYIFT